ncbi:acyltransferase family protein, partial [Klebsiella pneumoniae]|uniref:acyltransferase family protein n=1 Tax=Klebsiella pneumoniae TaxID=573 RepID=UPI003F2597BA
ATRPDRRAPALVRALGTRPLQVVGDWSYSLYLWHWPVLVLVEAQTGPRTPLTTALALVLTVALSALTHRFVEAPFRSPRTFTVPRGLMLYPV